jgi:hypothetical protein
MLTNVTVYTATTYDILGEVSRIIHFISIATKDPLSYNMNEGRYVTENVMEDAVSK